MSDLISRSALMREIGATVVFSVRNYPSAEIRGANKVIDRIKAAPAVDAVPVVHGRWLHVKERRLFGEEYYLCSRCKTRNGMMIDFNYCPNCGAKMDGGEEDGK